MAKLFMVVASVLGLALLGESSSQLSSLSKTNSSSPTWNHVSNSSSPTWNQVSISWLKWMELPMTTVQARTEGWVQNKRCNDRKFFRGSRYTIGNDKAIMLLFDGDQNIIGIQGGLSKKKVSRKTLPWKREKGYYVMTAYIQDPVSACSTNRSSSRRLGNQLLIQNGSSADYIRVPLQERRLNGTKWVKGGCVWSMGQLYWYNISPRTACRDLFPVFLMYNNGELNGFGWVVMDNVTSSTYVQATTSSFKYLFKNGTIPECVMTAGQMSLQHVFLDRQPFFNIC